MKSKLLGFPILFNHRSFQKSDPFALGYWRFSRKIRIYGFRMGKVPLESSTQAPAILLGANSEVISPRSELWELLHRNCPALSLALRKSDGPGGGRFLSRRKARWRVAGGRRQVAGGRWRASVLATPLKRLPFFFSPSNLACLSLPFLVSLQSPGRVEKPGLEGEKERFPPPLQ